MAQRVERWIEVTPVPVHPRGRGPEHHPALLPDQRPVPRLVELRVPRRPGQVARGRPAGPRPPPPAPGRAEVLLGHPARRRPDLAARRAPRRGLPAQARPAQGAAAGQQAPGRAAPLGAGDRHTAIPDARDRRAVRAGVRVPAPPRLQVRAAAGLPDRPVRPRRHRGHDTGLPGISERLLEAATPHQSVGANRDDIIAALMAADRRSSSAASARPARGSSTRTRWARATAGRTGRPSTGWPPRSGRASGSSSPRPVRPRPPGRRSARSPSTSTGSCPGCPTTGCCARRDLVDNDLGVGPGLPARRPIPAARPVAGRPGRAGARRGPALAAAAGRRGGGLRAPQPGRAPRPHPARRLGPAPAGRRRPQVLVGDWQSAGTVAGPG